MFYTYDKVFVYRLLTALCGFTRVKKKNKLKY